MIRRIVIPNWLTYGILVVAAFLFVFLFSCTTSPLYEHYLFWFHGDSGIFQEMGVCLLQGGIPYVDLFDHKGPILWFFQALGIWISPHWGLMAMQSISIFFTFLLWYKTTRLLIDKQIESIIISFIGLLFLMAFYERGNLCEEWSLPFISLPIYLYVKRWKAASELQAGMPAYQRSDIFLMGICVGIIAMIRLNNTAPIVGFALWHFVVRIKQKEYKNLLTDVILIFCGMAIVILSCALFYLKKTGWNGVYEMIYGTYIFNYLYMSVAGVPFPFIRRLQFYIPIVGFLILSIFPLKRKSSTSVIKPILISYLITLIAIGQNCYYHYLIIAIPLFVITFCLSIQSHSFIKYAFLGCLIIDGLFDCHDPISLLIYRFTHNPPPSELRHESFHHFISSLPLEEKRSIYSYEITHGQGLLAKENIFQCNRILNSNHLIISPHLQEYEKTHGIKDLQPIWILTQSPRPEATDEYMATHYTLADSIPGGEFDPIWCWKVKR